MVGLSHALKDKVAREAEEERARKVELIQQIRLLERSIPSVGSCVKTLDLTETSNSGLLGEMSIVEVSLFFFVFLFSEQSKGNAFHWFDYVKLQERLVLINVRHREYEESKRAEIQQHKTRRVAQLALKLKDIDLEREQRRLRRAKAEGKNCIDVNNPVSSSVLASAAEREVIPSSSLSSSSLPKKKELLDLQEKLKNRKAQRIAALSAKKSSLVASSLSLFPTQGIASKRAALTPNTFLSVAVDQFQGPPPAARRLQQFDEAAHEMRVRNRLRTVLRREREWLCIE